MQILDHTGNPIPMRRLHNSFAEWRQSTLDPSAKAAWDHQELKLQEIRLNYTEEVCRGKDGLRARIEEQNKTIDELKKFCEENLKIMSEMEIKLTQLQG